MKDGPNQIKKVFTDRTPSHRKTNKYAILQVVG